MRNDEIRHHKTIVYHFKLNELVKRTNREIKRYLKKYINYK